MSKKVIVVVDVQNDFVKGGALPYGYPQKDIVRNICDYVRKASSEGHRIVATRDTHHENYAETLEGQKLPVKHCIHDTHGWSLVSELNEIFASGKLTVFDKPTFGTPLVAEYIRGLMDTEDIEEIVVIGFDLSICVLANAVLLRARFPNKRITILKDLCGDVDIESYNAALKVLANQQCEVV